MPAVHSHQVRSVRFSIESYLRQGCASVTFYDLAVSSIHPGKLKKKTIKNQRRQPGETRDSLTRTPQTAKKARANEARHEHLRLYESIRGEASVSNYILTLALRSLGVCVQLA